MEDTTIMIPVDSQSTQAYLSASAEERQKIQFLLRLRLRELTRSPSQSHLSGLSVLLAEVTDTNCHTEITISDMTGNEVW